MWITLDTVKQAFEIDQTIFFQNTSQDTLQKILLQDWNHAYSDKNAPLGKRFLENYSKKFFFSSEKNRGYTDIKSMTTQDLTLYWKRKNPEIDQIWVDLLEPLLPDQEIEIRVQYILKLPHAKFTGYGQDKENFHLKNWYIVPAVYDGTWQGNSNLDIDQVYQEPIDFEVLVSVPDTYQLVSNLEVYQASHEYFIKGNAATSFDLEVLKENKFSTYQIGTYRLVTDLNDIEISNDVKENVLQRQFQFLINNLGDIPQKKLIVNKIEYDKHPLYGFNQLPNFLRPFPDIFEWDIRMFKTLSEEFVEQCKNKEVRADSWLKEGISPYLIQEYIRTFYPEQKLIGNISKIWGVRSYHIASLRFNERFNLATQYVVRQNLDQRLTTSLDSLTNFNRSVGQKFKTANLLLYLKEYLGEETLTSSLKSYFQESIEKPIKTEYFLKELEKNAAKPITWFTKDYLNDSKKIDYRIKDLVQEHDSITIYLENLKKQQIPVILYGMKQHKVVSKYTLPSVSDVLEFKVPYQGETQWSINPYGFIPDVKAKNDLKKTKKGLFSKPLKIRWLTDVENPEVHQVFLEPKFFYNYYDGFSLASSIHNKTMLHTNFTYQITPAYGFKSQNLTGSMLLKYYKFLEHKKINSYRVGVVSNYFHYKPELSYTSLSTYANLFFKRKNLRSPKGQSLNFNYTRIQKDLDPNSLYVRESDSYGVLHLNYTFSNNEIIQKRYWGSNIELGTNFSKLYSEFIVRKQIADHQQFEVRVFGGLFLHNNTESDYFSFGVNRPNDYLFRYNYFGRSESSGFLSQQFILNDAGFKANMSTKYANQWIFSINTSLGIWKWVEMYNDVGLAKNRNIKAFFAHDMGIRLNFVSNMLELYFPVYSNNGWEIADPHYEKNIRFVLTTDFKVILAYLKRGVL